MQLLEFKHRKKNLPAKTDINNTITKYQINLSLIKEQKVLYLTLQTFAVSFALKY
jgi:hypothetical protein